MAALTGCGVSVTSAPATALQGAAIQGKIHGGNQPVVGAKVYLLAAGTSTGAASTSLLSATKTGNAADTIGSYVLSDSNGDFTITSDYTCTFGQQVYLYALGGNPGAGGVNTAAGFLAVLGTCPAVGYFPSSTSVFVNEVTTVAAAFALSGYATDATHIASSGTTLALTGIANAFATAANLANLSTGVAYATTPAGNAVVPQSTINTLANILAACINSSSSSSSNCLFLFASAKAAGSLGTSATDTATAAIYIAHNPAANPSTLFAIQPGTGAPFAPALTTAPNDFTLELNYTGGGINKPEGIAVDASGNVWVANFGSTGLTEILSSGAFASGSPFTGGGLTNADAVAIDSNGYVWVANASASVSSLSKFTNTGTPVSTVLGYTGGGISSPASLAVDTSNNIWIGNGKSNTCLSEVNNSGIALSGTNGYTGGGCSSLFGLAFDPFGYLWAANADGTAAVVFSSTGTLLHATRAGGIATPVAVAVDSSFHVWFANSARGSNNLTELTANSTAAITPVSSASGITGAGLATPYGIATDGAGNIWVANYSPGGLSEFNKAGTPVSPSGSGTFNGGYGSSNATLTSPYAIAVDGSGNVWVADYGSSNVIELVGAGAPVVTPIVASLLSPYGLPGMAP